MSGMGSPNNLPPLHLRVFSKIFVCFLKYTISTNPKAYFAICRDSDVFKRSSKGVQHRISLDYDQFKDVIYRSSIEKAKNVSIRVFRGQMSTVETQKIGLRNIFVKAFVQEDKITVKPFSRFSQNK